MSSPGSGDTPQDDEGSGNGSGDDCGKGDSKPMSWSMKLARDNHLLLSGFFFYLMGSLVSYNATAMPAGLRKFLAEYHIGRIFLTVIFLYFASSFVNDQAYALRWTKTVWSRFAITGILLVLYFTVTSLNTIGYAVTLVLLLTIYTLNDIARNAKTLTEERKEDLRYAGSILTFITAAWIIGALITNIVLLKGRFRHPLLTPSTPWVPSKAEFRREEKESGL